MVKRVKCPEYKKIKMLLELKMSPAYRLRVKTHKTILAEDFLFLSAASIFAALIAFGSLVTTRKVTYFIVRSIKIILNIGYSESSLLRLLKFQL